MGSWKTLGTYRQVDALLLLTDGTIMTWATRRKKIRLLAPDKHGSYDAPKTSKREDLPGEDHEHAGAVLADGCVFKLGNSRAHLYDPVSAEWTPVAVPASNWKSTLIVLADGRVMTEDETLARKVSLYEPSSGRWTDVLGLSEQPNIGPRVLLPDGQVFALTKSHVHLFQPVSKTWKALGNGPSLPAASPAVLLPDGRVLVVDTGQAKLHYFTPPNASLPNGAWSAGPTLPATDTRGWSLRGAMGALSVLPSGKVLCGAEYLGRQSIGYQALVMYELEPKTGTLTAQENTEFVREATTGYFETPRAVSLLVLPTGQVFVNLVVDPTLGQVVAKDFLYTPTDGPNPDWAPTFTSPGSIRAGTTFYLEGYGFNGVTQAVSRMASGGEDALMGTKPTLFSNQGATNYPLVQFSHGKTVSYLRTSDMSTMGVATGATKVSVRCEAPADLPTGPGQLRVVANGIPSAWQNVSVLPALEQPSYEAFGQYVIALLGGGEDGPSVLTPHGIEKVPPDDPLHAEALRLSGRIEADLQRLAVLGRVGDRIVLGTKPET